MITSLYSNFKRAGVNKMHDKLHEEKTPLIKVLAYLQAHNEEHADETAAIAAKLADEGHTAEADIIRDGVKLIHEGNAKVAEALELLEKGK
jgi:hypothetical protein